MDYCSFCGKKNEEFETLLEGRPGVAICNYCIDYGKKFLKGEGVREDAGEGVECKTLYPIDVVNLLDKYVIGQDEAKKDLAVAVYNHFKRLKYGKGNDNVDVEDDVEISKSNIMLIGNSGTGKTLLAQTLARILNVPFTIADATNITEAGYVGSDVETIFQPLLARYDVKEVEKSIVYIDECFLGHTEVLTNEGFKRFDTLTGDEKVLQYSVDGTMDFVSYEKVSKRYEGEIIRIVSKNFVHLSTNLHDRVLVSKKIYKEEAYKSIGKEHLKSKVPVGAVLKNEDCDISDDLLRYLAVFCINGTVINDFKANIHLNIYDERNNVLIELLNKLPVSYNIYENLIDDEISFYSYSIDVDKSFPKTIDRDLVFSLSHRQRRLLLESLKFWSGSYKVKNEVDRFQISTNIKEKANVLQELCHVTGMKARICKEDAIVDSWYVVNITDIDEVSQQDASIEHIKYTGNVYCVKVPSKMIMIRQNGFVQITGNCDKKARKSSANPSLTRDVSGESVQNALLKIVEGNVIDVPEVDKRKHPQKQNIKLDTSNILFILGGAFDGLKQILAKRLAEKTVGFKGISSSERDSRNLHKTTHKDLINYGIIPELAGRVPVISVTNDLTVDDLCKILTEPKNAVIKQYQKLMKMDGIDLIFEEDAVQEIASRAFKEGNGARSLKTIAEKVLKKVMFESPGKDIDKIVFSKNKVNEILDNS